MNTPPVRIRAHHLLCLLSFSGDGYSDSFVEKFHELAGIYRGPNSIIEVLDCPDDACAACPHISPENGCMSPRDGPESEVRRLDHAVLNMLGIKPGIHRTDDLHAGIAKVSETDLHATCKLCSWYDETDCQRLILEWVRRAG